MHSPHFTVNFTSKKSILEYWDLVVVPVGMFSGDRLSPATCPEIYQK